MSKISIKKDFLDGTTLPATDLNNNFMVIEAGINANEENLQEVINEAIVRLDHELEEITADRGWDWNGGNRVTFYKGDTDAIEARDIINGQLLYNTETGETALDDSNNRIVTGSGNVVAIGEIQPTNPATKLLVQPSKMVKSPVNIINMVYPIGSYYETSDATFNPNITWGGTWILEEDGTVLVSGSSTSGSIFNDDIGEIVGEEKHTLTVSELPSNIIQTTTTDSSTDGYIMRGGYTSTGTYNIGGSGNAHNIVQPSKIVNRWHRTA